MFITIAKNNLNKFHILKNYTAGVILKGWEVKSIKNKDVIIKNSYIYVINKELFLKNLIITKKDKFLNRLDFNRLKKILLNKFEIKEIILKIKKKFKIVIFKIILNSNLIKIILSLINNFK